MGTMKDEMLPNIATNSLKVSGIILVIDSSSPFPSTSVCFIFI